MKISFLGKTSLFFCSFMKDEEGRTRRTRRQQDVDEVVHEEAEEELRYFVPVGPSCV
jgi:hypothetical protein